MMKPLHCALIFLICVSFSRSATEIITSYEDVRGQPYTVTYDHRSLLIDGKRALLLSGCIHYPRSTPGMWDDLMIKAKKEGLNTIETYVFWNFHEHKQGVYNFDDRGDLQLFLEKAANNGLFVNLRIGPYVCAEWNYGGLPVWLNNVPGISFRTYNEPWMKEMQRWMQDLVDFVRPWLAGNGGPIILAQVENEYHGSQDYVDWCGQLAESLDIGVPWEMCNGLYANNTIETCNSCFCDDWIAGHWQEQPDKPAMWTENEGWFQQWGLAKAERPPEDLSVSVARFIEYGGSLHNYYMWHGGNHYGRWGGSSITNMYADDVNLHANGIPNEPKYSHLAKLHFLLLHYADAILGQDVPPAQPLPYWNGHKWVPGQQQVAHVYTGNGGYLAFISSTSDTEVITLFNNQTYTMPPNSVSLVDAQGHEIYNTGKVSPKKIQIRDNDIVGPFTWTSWSGEYPPEFITPAITADQPYEQLNVTQDDTEYLWYRTKVTTTSGSLTLSIDSQKANAFMVFIDGKFTIEQSNYEHNQGAQNFTFPLRLTAGTHTLDILSVSLGIDNGVSADVFASKGITGNVQLGTFDKWNMQPFLIGEYLQIYGNGAGNVNWTSKLAVNKPLTWYQTTFARPSSQNTVFMLNVTGMGRGHAYINGNDLGRYWTLPGSCDGDVPCAAPFDPSVCGKPTQILYHIPPDWIGDSNTLTLIEELGGDPSQVTVVIQDDFFDRLEKTL